MGDETMDTSGVVRLSGQFGDYVAWVDLSPFTQGYVRALFESATAALEAERERRWARWLKSPAAERPRGERFSDLAPEALAEILKDCAYAQHPDWKYSFRDGGWLWKDRQDRKWAKLPPLTVTLADDGKIHLRTRDE